MKYYYFLGDLPQNTQNKIRQLIKAYYDENNLNYKDYDIDDIFNQKIVDIMYLDDTDIYLVQIDNILKQYV